MPMKYVLVQYTNSGHFLLIHEGEITHDDKSDALGLRSLEESSGLEPLLKEAAAPDLSNRPDYALVLAAKLATVFKKYHDSGLTKYGNKPRFVPPDPLKEALDLPASLLVEEFIKQFPERKQEVEITDGSGEIRRAL